MLSISQALIKYIEGMEKTAQMLAVARTSNDPRSTANTNMGAPNSLDAAIDGRTQHALDASGKTNVTKSIADAHGYGHGHPPASMPGASSRSSIMATNAKENQRPRKKSRREVAGSEAKDISQDTRPSNDSPAPRSVQFRNKNLSNPHDTIAPKSIPKNFLERGVYMEHCEHKPAVDYDGYQGDTQPLSYIPPTHEACIFEEAEKRVGMRNVPVAGEQDTQVRLQSVHQSDPTTNDFVSRSNSPQIGLMDTSQSSVLLHVHPNAPAALASGLLSQPHSSRSTSVSSLSNSARQPPNNVDMASPMSFESSRVPHYFDSVGGFSPDSLAHPETSSIMTKRRASASSSALRDEDILRESAASANQARKFNGRFATSNLPKQATSAQPIYYDGSGMLDDVFRQSLDLASQPISTQGLKKFAHGESALLSPTALDYGAKGEETLDVEMSNIGSTVYQDVSLNLLNQPAPSLSHHTLFPQLQTPLGCTQCYDAIYPPPKYDPKLSITVLRCCGCKRNIGEGNVGGGNGSSYYGKEADKVYLDWCIEHGILEEVLDLGDVDGEDAFFTSFYETPGSRNNFDDDFDFSKELYKM